MSLEIERKWRVTEAPELRGPGAKLRQGYITSGEGATEVRVRDKNGKFKLTVKRGKGLTRAEVEIDIAKDQFDALWPLTEGARIEKRRYERAHGDRMIELDVFEGRLDGLMVAEVEFPSEESANRFEAPEWFGEELTGKKGWSNAELARSEAP